MAEAVKVVKDDTDKHPGIPNVNNTQKKRSQGQIENIDEGKQKSKQIVYDMANNNKKKKKPKPMKKNSSVGAEIQKKNVRTPFPPHTLTPRLTEPQKYICMQHHIVEKASKFRCELCSNNSATWTNLEQHVSSPSHIRALEEFNDALGIKLLPPPLERQKEVQSDLIKRIVTEHGINKAYERRTVATNIQNSISKSLEGCTVKVYGSSLYFVGLTTSDLNVNISIPSSLNLPNTMMAIFEQLKEDTSKRDVKFKMLSASGTSITFQDISSELPCCITFNNNHYCEVAQILTTYFSLDERAMQLATAFRYWAYLCCLDQIDYGTLPAYAFPILVIYYLQQLEDPVLPVLDVNEIRKEEAALPDVFDPRCLNIRWQTRNRMSLGELWIGLFKYYVLNFDPNTQVVSIRSKQPVYQNSKNWSYKRFGIEDPAARDRNLAKTLVNLRSVHYLLHCLRTSATYFATPQVKGIPIFRRVQPLPPAIGRLTHVLKERDLYVKYIFQKHPFFLTDELKERNMHQVLTPDNPNFSNIGFFIVTPEQSVAMFEKFNPAYLDYEFHRKHFAGERVRPLICILCREEGHSKDKCPWDSLPPLEKLPDLSKKYFKKLSVMCKAIYDKWSLTSSELAARKRVVSDLFRYLKPRFPDVTLTLFGSSCNGFGLKRSDIDICFTFSTCPPGENLDFAKLIQDLHGLLKSYYPFTNLVPITTAKVPILKFLHLDSNLDGDISFHNTLALKNTKLISTYSNIDERAKILGYVVKCFTKISRICDASKGSLSSYAYILMMIHYLQQCNPPVLPVLQEICRPSSSEEHTLENCDVYFFEDIDRLSYFWPEFGKNNQSVGELWIGFLCYYTEVFDFSECVITIRRKKPLSKFEKLWNFKSMAIEDPFDVGHNLGVGLNLKMHQYILKAFINGRMYFSTEANMPQCKSLPKTAENYFEGSEVKGSPPDRGCHHCKKIGHIIKECPILQHKKGNSGPRENQRDRPSQSPKPGKPFRNAVKGSTKRNPNLDVDLMQDSFRLERGRRSTWWNQSIPRTLTPVVHHVSNSNWNTRPMPLNNVNVPPEIGMQIQALAQKWRVGPQYKNYLKPKEKQINVNQPPQKVSGEIFDAYSKPSSSDDSEIPPVKLLSYKVCDDPV